MEGLERAVLRNTVILSAATALNWAVIVLVAALTALTIGTLFGLPGLAGAGFAAYLLAFAAGGLLFATLVTLIANLAADLAYGWLDTDGAAAFGEAFDMLYELGHRRFGLVTISEPMTFRHLRQDGLADAMARRGDPSVKLQVVTAPRFDRGARIQAINKLLSGPDRPTAILGLFDEIALTVMEEAQRAGLSIPNDLSVIGFDNIGAAAYAPPGLTTFDASIRQCAREIAEMLLAAIETTPAKPLTRLLRPTLTPRASHGPAPGKRG
jgi:LacI family transcriptional regulator